MLPSIRAVTPKAFVARRFISQSSKANAAASIAQNAMPATANGSRTAKAAAYTVLGGGIVVAGAAVLLKDEVVYWTPNVRK
ncbi:hypothetical protein BX616_000942 [Lobosporangium transversale]|nr:hypothetical protein BX616_000942 [Lobosporangium transversale]